MTEKINKNVGNESPGKENPIISSLLDTDFYKLTMGQFVYNRYPDVIVKYSFKNRTSSVNLAEVVDENDLRRELNNIRSLSLTNDEVNYLKSLKYEGKHLFKEDYIDFLKNIELPTYELSKEKGFLKLEFTGPWSKSIYWETLALSVINELYYKEKLRGMNLEEVEAVYSEGKKRLKKKVRTLRENPEIKFIEFGTRRRFSSGWQSKVVSYLKEHVPSQITGTSNVYLAMKHGLDPKGTMAHETFMVMSGIMHDNDESIRNSHNQVLKEWWEEYGESLSIALTDTYGSEFFFKDITPEQARNWKGLRQDSGDPREFARHQIEFYNGLGIDPKEKLFVPSDGLEIEKMVSLQKEYGNKINIVSGWGTNLTNDMGLKPLSLVIKAVEANGHGTVKLSDNSAKSTGEPSDISRFIQIFEYPPFKYKTEECKY
ncbi:MAG: nicotinate phosphoribosyltransferase [Nanoarchaeota archaeon]|nr:nicotinate phosphoribosyltransferase [Nanoarchaeota archaeon]